MEVRLLQRWNRGETRERPSQCALLCHHLCSAVALLALTMTIAALAVSKAEMLADGKKQMYEGQIVELELKLQVRAGDTHTHLIETDTRGRERDTHVVLTWIWLTMTSDDDADRL